MPTGERYEFGEFTLDSLHRSRSWSTKPTLRATARDRCRHSNSSAGPQASVLSIVISAFRRGLGVSGRDRARSDVCRRARRSGGCANQSGIPSSHAAPQCLCGGKGVCGSRASYLEVAGGEEEAVRGRRGALSRQGQGSRVRSSSNRGSPRSESQSRSCAIHSRNPPARLTHCSSRSSALSRSPTRA
jgi:hypothetical protein